MKKILLLILFYTSVPVFALCSIDDLNTVCTLPGFREQISPVLNDSSHNAGLSQPSLELQPLQRQDPIENMRGPNNKLNYNSSCQFGVCLQDPKQNTLLQQK